MAWQVTQEASTSMILGSNHVTQDNLAMEDFILAEQEQNRRHVHMVEDDKPQSVWSLGSGGIGTEHLNAD